MLVTGERKRSGQEGRGHGLTEADIEWHGDEFAAGHRGGLVEAVLARLHLAVLLSRCALLQSKMHHRSSNLARSVILVLKLLKNTQ